MAVAPTEVDVEVVAGYGPPWCWAGATATPVGQPLTRTRPASGVSAARSPAALPSASSVAIWRVAVRLPGSRDRTVVISSSEV